MSTDDGRDVATQHGHPATPFTGAWWSTSHPTFAGITGFFAGMLYVALVPGGIAAVLRYVLDDQGIKTAFLPVVIALIVLPVVLLVPRKTRRFGTFVLVGMAVTIAVVLGVTSLVLYLMVQTGQ